MWSGSPVTLSQTTVVSLWFVIPTAVKNKTEKEIKNFNKKYITPRATCQYENSYKCEKGIQI